MENSPLPRVEDIFNRLNEERKTGELLPLEIDIYKKNEVFAAGEENEERYIGNLRKLMSALRERRIQKILTYIAYGRSLPHQIPEEEERIYIRIKEIIKEEERGPSAVHLKILADTPEVVTPEGKKIGPFKKNTTAAITDASDAEFMIKNKIGETTKM